MSKNILVRVLVEVVLVGLTYKPDQVVAFPTALAKSLERDGIADSNKAAVAYCLDTLGAKIITHAPPEPPIEPPVEGDTPPQETPADPPVDTVGAG